jgi:hypothetical protein
VVQQECGAALAPLFLVRLMRDAVGLKPTRATVPPGRAQFSKPNAFLFSKLTKICKLWKPPFYYCKIYQTLKCNKMEDKEQLSLWTQVQIQIRNRTKNPGSKNAFEFGPNLLGVQTSLEKSGKFPKILICLGLPDCEFRLTWLYGGI